MASIGPGELWSEQNTAEVSDAALCHCAEHGVWLARARETESGA